MGNIHLCKAKRIDNQKWVEGYYVKHVDTCVCFSGDLKSDNIHHWIIFDGFCDWGFEPPLMRVDIDPSTLCRCTGLKDKHGKLIWENDVVRFPDYELCVSGDTETFENTGHVEWDEESMSFYFTDRNVISMDDIDISSEVEVTGDIFSQGD